MSKFLVFILFYRCSGHGWMELATEFAKSSIGKSDKVIVDDLVRGSSVDVTSCGSRDDSVQLGLLTFDREQVSIKIQGTAERDLTGGTVVSKISIGAQSGKSSIKSKLLHKLGYILGGRRTQSDLCKYLLQNHNSASCPVPAGPISLDFPVDRLPAQILAGSYTIQTRVTDAGGFQALCFQAVVTIPTGPGGEVIRTLMQADDHDNCEDERKPKLQDPWVRGRRCSGRGWEATPDLGMMFDGGEQGFKLCHLMVKFRREKPPMEADCGMFFSYGKNSCSCNSKEDKCEGLEENPELNTYMLPQDFKLANSAEEDKTCSSEHHAEYRVEFGLGPEACALHCKVRSETGRYFMYRRDGPGGGQCTCTMSWDQCQEEERNTNTGKHMAIYEYVEDHGEIEFEMESAERDYKRCGSEQHRQAGGHFAGDPMKCAKHCNRGDSGLFFSYRDSGDTSECMCTPSMDKCEYRMDEQFAIYKRKENIPGYEAHMFQRAHSCSSRPWETYERVSLSQCVQLAKANPRCPSDAIISVSEHGMGCRCHPANCGTMDFEDGWTIYNITAKAKAEKKCEHPDVSSPNAHEDFSTDVDIAVDAPTTTRGAGPSIAGGDRPKTVDTLRPHIKRTILVVTDQTGGAHSLDVSLAICHVFLMAVLAFL